MDHKMSRLRKSRATRLPAPYHVLAAFSDQVKSKSPESRDFPRSKVNFLACVYSPLGLNRQFDNLRPRAIATVPAMNATTLYGLLIAYTRRTRSNSGQQSCYPKTSGGR